LQFDRPEDFMPPQDEHEYTAKLRSRLQDVYDDVNKRLQTYTERMKNRYDAKVIPNKLSEGA
jgi:guanylate kinase